MFGNKNTPAATGAKTESKKMSTQIIPFNFEDNHVRVVTLDDQAWFVARDVATVLGYSDATNAVKQHCRGVAKHHPIVDRLGREQEVRIISESDTLRLIVSSKLPSAVKFEQLVFEEILPQIARTGSYGQTALSEDEIVHQALQITARKVEALEGQVAEMEPKAAYHDTFVADSDLRIMRNVAKSIGVTETALRDRLIDQKWIYKETSSRWSEKHQKKVPHYRYSPYSHKAHLFMPMPVHDAPRFKGEVMHTLKVTPQGALAIAKLFGKEMELV